MRPIEQDRFAGPNGELRGNCVAACIASIFEVPLSDVNIRPGGYYEDLCRWTRESYPALRCVHRYYSTLRIHDEPAEGEEATYDYQEDRLSQNQLRHRMSDDLYASYWIAGVESPRITLDDGSPGLHAVVMRGSELVWDPHPQRAAGVGPFRSETYWTLADPAKL